MKIKLRVTHVLTILIGFFLFVACNNDDNGTPMLDPPAEMATEIASKTFTLGSVSDETISGTAKFATFSNDSTVVELALTNTTAGSHPAHIHFNTAAEGGDIAIDLTAVDGANGQSSTYVTTLKDGTAISYQELLDYDGYINVHLSTDDLETLLAQGDIGQNELTKTSKIYDLGSVDVDDIDGTATFTKRANGEALAEIQLNNTPADGMHPGHIHANTAAEGGDIVFNFLPVNGETGSSKTNVAELEDGSPFLYDDVLAYDGYINIHLSMEDLGTLIAQGDIGQNELTGESKTYILNSVDVPNIDGTATFSERLNGEALAIIALNNTTEGGMHPGHIHANNAAMGGPIIFSFNPVKGVTGISKTNVAALDDDTAFGYADILTVDGYINIHLSMDELGTLITQGDIGVNEDMGVDSVNFDVTNTGATAYIFNGGGLSDASNPDISLERGKTYTFTVNASGHPFFIKTVQGNTNGDAYNAGVTGNGEEVGTVTFVVPTDAPDTLYYNCQFHSSMTGAFNITG